MKKFLTTTVLLAMFATCTTVMANTGREEYLGLPGDNLNLYAVMKLFQESPTLEAFERKLNDENSRINNLDLNGDNYIDYIKVIDYPDRDVHNIVLQVAINKRENQDVAVFTVQRFSDGQVQIQLVGDEALYGRNYIIEPIYDDQYAGVTPNPGYSGNVTVVRTTYYEVAAWPVIRYIYLPNYVVWHSQWYWGYWPTYWHPWRPYYWHYYYGYHYNWYNDYYCHYRHSDYHRYSHWDNYYHSNRHSYSPYVSERIKSGHYKSTYSHPDQRREGEALYARTNPDRGNRRNDQYSVSNTAGKSDYQANENRRSAGTSVSTAGRTNTTVTKAAVKPVTVKNNGSERRSAATNSDRTAVKTAPKQSAGTARKSAAVINDRPAPKSVTTYNSFSERRKATTVSDRPAANSKNASGTVKSRSAEKQAPKGESFSSRRSSTQSQSAKTAKSSDNKKSTEPAKNKSRR
jgi:hypothetical protein